MAVIPFVRTEQPGRTYRFVWANMAGGDSGEPISIPGASDKTFQVYGTFGTSTVALQGSLDTLDNGTYANLTDPQGNALSALAAAALESITENTLWIKPVVAAGTGSGLTVIVLARSTM